MFIVDRPDGILELVDFMFVHNLTVFEPTPSFPAISFTCNVPQNRVGEQNGDSSIKFVSKNHRNYCQ